MTPAPGLLRALPAAVLIGVVRTYQLVVSPLLGPTCRFYPSCSSYAVQALRRHGALRGSWLTLRRLARCNPWNPGGVDHVPEESRSFLTRRRPASPAPHHHDGAPASSTPAA